MRLALLLLLLLLPLPSHADERAALRQAASRLQRSQAPTALADVLAAERMLGAVAPADVVRALTPAAQKWLSSPRTRNTVVATFLADLLAEAARRAGQAPALARFRVTQGVVTRWSWLGPFGAEHGSAFTRQSPVEREAQRIGAGQIAPQPAWPGRAGQVAWRPVADGLMGPTGRLHVDEWVEQPDDALVFLQAWVRPRTPGLAQLRAGVVGAVRVYLDGAALTQMPEHAEQFGLTMAAPLLPDVPLATVALSAGWHRLLIKVAPSAGNIPVRISWVDPQGAPFALDVRADLPPADSLAQVATPTDAEALPPEPTWQPDGAVGLHWPLAGAVAKPSPLPTLVALAWHSWPLHPDVTERLLALDPAELPPDGDGVVGLALLAGELGDRIDRLRLSANLLPDNAELLLAQASALDAMGKTSQAHRLWQEWSAANGRRPEDEFVRGCVLRSALWTRLGGDAVASELLAQCAKRWPDAPELLEARIRDAVARDDLTGAVALHQRWLALEPGRLDVQTGLLTALLDAARLPEAETQATLMAQQFPGRSRGWELVARHHLAQNEPGEALADLARLPGHLVQASTLELKARALGLTHEKPEEAIAALQTAVERAPARADLRWRLAQLQPEGEFFTPYRRDLVALVRKELDGPREHAAEERLQQTVIQGVGNGQQAQYEALVRYLGPGCEANQTVDIDYAPTLSRADVLQAVIVRQDGRVEPCTSQNVDQFGEDASGMYFDLERITLHFNNLRPGDAIVVEHVERDLAPTPFGLVFGELLTLGDVRPVRETDVVLLLPAGTPLRTQVVDPRPNQPPIAQMVQRRVQSADQHDRGAWDEWRLRLGPQAAVVSERNMPGTTDVMPYLHASTFASWTALTQWWSQLAAEAIPARGTDPVVHAEALRLTQGLTTDAEKVRALYAFATTQVRYVGLEFGIHSLKPHAVREVLQRAFGDCKDKATLLVALLAEVGIDAQVVLVRTADNGQLHDEVASLGVFNHAIAYVPSLTWWLDATATHHGPQEMPEGDAGGVALRIAKPGAAPARPEVLPDGPPREHLQTVKIEAKIQTDGAALLEVDFEMHGRSAAEARSQLWVDTSRREQMEQFLSARFPGVVVQELTTVGIEPLGETVKLHVKARVAQWARHLPDGGLSVQPLRPSQPYVQLFGVQAGRKQPLVLAHAAEMAHVAWLVPPAGYAIARQPAPVDDSARGADGQPLGSFSLRSEMAADGALTLRTHLQLDRRVVAAQDVPALLRFLTAVDNVLRADIPLRKLEVGR